MKENRRLEWLLECLIHVIGRAAVKMDEVREVVGTGAEQVQAYNVCDGSMNLKQIAKRSGLDQGNLSRSLDRWVKNGILFRFEDGNEVRLFHIFQVPSIRTAKRETTRKNRRQL